MKKRLRILLVEDSKDDALLIERALAKDLEFELKLVAAKDAMADALRGGSWDVIVADYNMPGFGGLAAFEMVKGGGFDVPFILVTGAIGDEEALEALKCGIDDYVLKANLPHLASTIQRVIAAASERRNRRRLEVELQVKEERLRRTLESFSVPSGMSAAPLERKIGLLLLLPLTGALAAVGSFDSFLRATRGDTHFVNVAGRQRMLAAELRSWANMVSIGQEEDRGGLRLRTAEFDAALAALRRGGSAQGYVLDPAPAEIRSALEAVADLWRDLKPDLNLIADAPRSSPAFGKAYGTIASRLQDLRDRSNRVLAIFHEREARQRRRMLYILVVIAGLMVLIFAAGLALSRRYISRPMGWLLSMLDLRLRHAETIIESIPAGILILGGDLTMIRANRTFREAFGFDEGAAARRPLEDVLPAAGLAEAVLEVLATGREKRALRLEAVGREGILKPLRATIARTHLAESEASALVIIEDVSEEERLREAAASVKSELMRIEWMLRPPAPSDTEGFVDSAAPNRGGIILQALGREFLGGIASEYMTLLGTSFAVCEKNGEYALLLASEWCRLLDRASRKLCRQSCWTLCSKEAIAGRRSVDIECSGGLRLHAEPIFAGDEVVGAVSFGYGDPPRDAAALRRLAEACGADYGELLREAGAYNSRPAYIIAMAKNRLRTSARLIGALVEREREQAERNLAEGKLRQAQKMEIVGLLAGGVAHDFNNLLTSILGYSALILQNLKTDDPSRADVLEIKDAGERASALTKQLLAFSRKQTLNPKRLDLNVAAKSLLSMLRRLIGEDIELLFLPQDRSLVVEADRGQIEQVVMNLAVNARDAMPNGGKIIIETASIEMEEACVHRHGKIPPGSYAMLSVADTGCGMSEAVQSHLFEPFFTTKETGKGTGLGLSTVFSIIAQSGGHIAVYSEEGRGTVFKIYLPRKSGEAENGEWAPQRAELPRGSGVVLLVEDEPSVRELARRALTLNGFEVIAAGDPLEALAVCARRKEPIRLLVTDMVMPKLNGLELARKVRASQPGIRVLYMSGYTDHDILEQGGEELKDAFLQKPFMPRGLLEKVHEILGTSPAA